MIAELRSEPVSQQTKQQQNKFSQYEGIVSEY